MMWGEKMRFRALVRSQHGQAIVETALIMPVLLLMILGMVELGRISNAYLMVTHAARHGARFGAVGGSNTEIIDKVNYAAATLDTTKLQVTIDPADNRVGGSDIRVTVNYPVQLLTPVLSSFLTNPFVVGGKVTMRVE
jgi:Flp pilus assembly protein TadG